MKSVCAKLFLKKTNKKKALGSVSSTLKRTV